MIRVKSVQPQSLGYELGFEPGTELLSIDGRELHDFLDWEFLTAEDEFVLLARSPEGESVEYDIERPEGMPLGVQLEPPRIRRCANRCDFCFVDGNPDGMRKALYIRDDDYRLSFRYGNFATLTNLKQADIDRIIEYRLSPLYVSVHATDAVVRRRLLRNPLAPDVVEQIREFGDHGIRCHTQIVLQPGLNDGDILRASLADLYGLGELVLSVSVVPVGLTEYSKHELVRELSKEECSSAVEQLEFHSARAKQERDFHWAYGSDDLYINAGLSLPDAARYDGFEQMENGVGSVRYLQQQTKELRADLSRSKVGVVTGTAMRKLMPMVLEQVASTTGATFELIAIENDLFGASVTSAGLLPGSGFLRALGTRTDLDLALIPAEAVSDDGVFLDDMTLEDLERQLQTKVVLSYHFSDALTNGVRR
jgi:putative radical SAM enzyme (TIGR03279 family)